MTLKKGQQAPDFQLPGVSGQTYSLREETKAGFFVLLIFLRHLG
jgi:peroxiredoxin